MQNISLSEPEVMEESWRLVGMACTYDNSKEEYESVRTGNLVSHAKLTHREAVPPVMAVMVVHRVGAPGTAEIVGAGASRLAAGLVDV